jgi:hypothetical protein
LRSSDATAAVAALTLPLAAVSACEYVAWSSASTLAGLPEMETVAAGELAGDAEPAAADGAEAEVRLGPAAGVLWTRPEEIGSIVIAIGRDSGAMSRRLCTFQGDARLDPHNEEPPLRRAAVRLGS